MLNVYCVNMNKICFKSWAYLKIMMGVNGVQLVSSIFKENDRDYIVVDHNGKVLAAGLACIDKLGFNMIGLPLQFLCEDPNVIMQSINSC